MVGGNYHTCLEKQVNFKALPTCPSVAIHGVFGLQYSPCHREVFCWPCINTGLLQLLSFDVTKKTQPIPTKDNGNIHLTSYLPVSGDKKV